MKKDEQPLGAITRSIFLVVVVLLFALQLVPAWKNWSWQVPRLGWTPDHWVVPEWFYFGLAILFCLAWQGLTRPLLGLVAAIVVAYGIPRYQPLSEWTFGHFTVESIIFVFLVACWTRHLGGKASKSRLLPLPAHHNWPLAGTLGRFALGALAAHVIVSAIANAAMESSGDWHWMGDLKHSPIRYLAGLAMCFCGVMCGRYVTLTSLGLILVATIAMRLALTTHFVRDADIAYVCVAVVPLAIGAAQISTKTVYAAIWWAIAAIGAAAVIATANRGGAMGLVVSIVVLVFAGQRKARMLLLLLLCVGAIVMLPSWQGSSLAERLENAWNQSDRDPTIRSRLDLWRASGRSLTGWQFLIGHGPGQGPRTIAIEQKTDELVAVHNTPLAVLVELGVIGAMLWLSLLGAAAAMFWKDRQDSKFHEQDGARLNHIDRWSAAARLSALGGMLGCGIAISRQDDPLMLFLVGTLLCRLQGVFRPGDWGGERFINSETTDCNG
ncbi:O-antigen ligase family protein [Roseiconus lacunae]|uniref:O-antigen ligase family protein n=1 Tax=Roseiconus lacunae TaxID=2605694 RepID=A0ABT7PQT6_9BACT|nr:O-antigen ligase family protein [Roseiconus lacunae]MDM4018831.1 O-antigen ligase family protein [Roseiconus lacunae]